jgi:outer membrane usher protein
MWRAIAALTLLALSSAECAAKEIALREAALEFSVNAQPGAVLVVMTDPVGGLWLSEREFQSLRLRVPAVPPRIQGGVAWYPLSAVDGVSVTLDDIAQRASIDAPPEEFVPTRLNLTQTEESSLTRASPGAFLNYQLSAQHIDKYVGGAFGELGVFGVAGVLTNTTVTRYGAGTLRPVRLETTFTRDFPDTLRTLNLGDAISDPGSYGNSVRFGGLRFSRNYGLRPDLLTMPMLTTSGTATVPSTVDVFVNNRLVSREALPPGPFVIDRLPAVSGSGEIRVVVRDALGREQVTTRSFYASTSLLARGLTQYALDLGAVREDYAIAGANYGTPLATSTYRRGLTDAATLEGHAEWAGDGLRNAGMNLAARLGRFGVVNTTLAAGGDPSGHGVLSGIGLEHRGRRASVLASISRASQGYRQLGDAEAREARLKTRALFQSGVSFDRGGSLAVAFVRETYLAQPSRRTLSLSHSMRVGELGMLSATALRVFGPQPSTAAFLMVTTSLDARRSASVSAISESDRGTEIMGTVMRNTEVGPSTGYRASASSSGDYDLAWDGRYESIDLQMQASRFDGTDGQSGFVSGAATWLDGELHAARSVTGSFAVIDVGAVPNVPVYLEHQPVGRTNARGRLILSDLRAYEANRVGVRGEELPLDTEIAAADVTIAPPYRSGVVARFPVTRIRHGTFRLVHRDGTPLPIGATVNFNGHRYQVVLDGVVYVTNFDHGLSAMAEWPGGRCRFRIPPPPAGEPLPDMGTLTCREAPLQADARPGVAD